MIAPYIPLFVADYLADTVHLTAAENGAYLLLIMNYWQRQKPLPDDDRKLAAIARMTRDEWKDARETIAEFFNIHDGAWHQKRIDTELAFIVERAEKNAAAGRASGAARRGERTPVERPLNARSTTVEPSGKVREDKKESGYSSDSTAPSCRVARDLDFIEAECREAAGVRQSPSPGLINLSPIIRCLDAGASLDADIIPTLRAMRSRQIKTWAYATQAIMDAKASREAPAPEGRATGPPQRTRGGGIEALDEYMRMERENAGRTENISSQALVLRLAVSGG